MGGEPSDHICRRSISCKGIFMQTHHSCFCIFEGCYSFDIWCVKEVFLSHQFNTKRDGERSRRTGAEKGKERNH